MIELFKKGDFFYIAGWKPGLLIMKGKRHPRSTIQSYYQVVDTNTPAGTIKAIYFNDDHQQTSTSIINANFIHEVIIEDKEI